MHYRRMMPASSLIGVRVHNAIAEELGKIEDLIIDVESGRVVYAVVQFGSLPGVGDKLFAVPWSALRVDRARRGLIVEVADDVLRTAPGFDKDDWPDLSNPDYARSIYRHYNRHRWH